jgi:hypothetical protein
VLSSQGAPKKERAFVWSQSGGMSGLVPPAGSPPYSESLSVSGDGSVVTGFAFDYDSQGQLINQKAFVWDAQNGVRWVEDLLAGHGLANDLAGWDLEQATGVSADGRTIVGFGTDPQGETRPWVAFIPEPSLGLLDLAALVAIATLRRSLRQM